MNPQWQYPRYSVPPPNVPVTYPAQQLQQNWSTMNASAAPQPVCSQTSNAKVPPIFTSVPPPSLAKPVQAVTNFRFNIPPPNLFPSNASLSAPFYSNFLSHNGPSMLNSSPSAISFTSVPPLPTVSPPPLPSDPPPPLPNELPPPVPVESPPPIPSKSSPPESVESLPRKFMQLPANTTTLASKLIVTSSESTKSAYTLLVSPSVPAAVCPSVQPPVFPNMQTVHPPPTQNVMQPPVQPGLHPTVQTVAVCTSQAIPFSTIKATSLPVVQASSCLPVQGTVHPAVQAVLPSVVHSTLPPAQTISLSVSTATPSVSNLPSCLPVPSYNVQTAPDLSKVNLSIPPAFTVPPPRVRHPYLSFAVQGTNNSIQTNIPHPVFTAPNVLQKNPSLNSPWNQIPLQNSYPSQTLNSKDSSISLDKGENNSSAVQYYCKDSFSSPQMHLKLNSSYKQGAHISSDGGKYHLAYKEEKYYSSHEEKHCSSQEEKHHSSQKEGKHYPSDKEQYHSYKEKYNLSHDEKHYSSHREERHYSPHKEKYKDSYSKTCDNDYQKGRIISDHIKTEYCDYKQKYKDEKSPYKSSADYQKSYQDDRENEKSETSCTTDVKEKCDSHSSRSYSKRSSSSSSSKSDKRKRRDSEREDSYKRSINQEQARSPKRARSYSSRERDDRQRNSRERDRSDRQRSSRERCRISRERIKSYSKDRQSRSRDERRSSSSERFRDQINDDRFKRTREQIISNRYRKRRRSSTPKDLPCLSPKTYKYIISTPAENYYCFKEEDSTEIIAKDALKDLHEKFKDELILRSEKVKVSKPKYEPPKRRTKLRKPKPPKTEPNSDSSSSEKSSSEEEDTAIEELERKKKHPDRLHVELWFNDPKEMNDGPLCRCSAKARRAGIRHGIYVGENPLPLCDPFTNNADKLYHYRITMTPHTNFLTKSPTTICHEGHEYRFEGFSMFSHFPLPQLPNCKVIRFNYEYTVLYIEEEFPKNFTIQGLELFNQYLLIEILELVDLNWKAHNDLEGCPRFHFMPRFTRELEDGGKEILAHCFVLEYLLKKNQILIDDKNLSKILSLNNHEWQDLADEVKGMIVTCPGMKPSSIRVDQLDREQCFPDKEEYPVIVHFGVRPPQLSYAGNPHYQKAWRDYVKYRHLLANKPKVRYADRHKLMQKENRLQAMRMENDLKRDVTVVISSKDFYKTGIMSDMIQHAMLLPVLVCHLRFHQSLTHLENKIGYQFEDRFLLQLALTHPSYRENFGTNPDHARNSLTNCGLRQPQYGDRRIHYMNTRKRGINTLINIMSRFGSRKETLSRINHNERLEFLGDAVVEFLSSIHLFYMFPDLEEGGLATYRAAIVQNQHLAVLSKKLELDRFMLYAHGSDLCHDLELRHAMANCFEALMGALFLDNGIEVADKVFSKTLFSEPELLEVWKNFSPHPLQEQEPNGDRKWIASVPLLQKLHKFEEAIGIEFNHIRLLARALTHRSLGYNNLTLGSNQRLEFLGDTVLQLVASEYLYKYFPEHHEGHLSLLRSSLVNNRTQAVVCADLGMVEYAIYPYSKVELKPKDKADLLEAFLGALYVDKDLGYCRKFCEVCFFPRLQDFIMNQDWNDPKSKLQQCCLTLRSMDGGEPDIPTYKVIECKGPTNTRVYSVAVYFQGNRLAVGTGHSIQQAEMDAAGNALKKSKDLFPQLRHQRRAIERSLKQGPPNKRKATSKDSP